MGRTNGKLKTFLRDGLLYNSFPNLKWEDLNSLIFSLKLPRYAEKKDLSEYEKILIEWYNVNNRNYPGYSGAKAVLQAALKKSVYLVCLNHNSNDHKIKFASKTEEQEKRRKQKLDTLILKDPMQKASHLNLSLKPDPDMPGLCKLEYSPLSSPISSSSFLSPPLPSLSPSPSNSSGYQSGNEELDESISASDETNLSEDPDFLKALDDLLENPDNYINALQDVPMDILQSDSIEGSVADIIKDDVKINDEFMQPSAQFSEKPVIELTATEVNSLKTLSTYWLCTRKLYIDSTLLLICDKQVIKDENPGIAPGQIDLNNVLEPGVSYNLQKMFEIDGKCFLFLSRTG